MMSLGRSIIILIYFLSVSLFGIFLKYGDIVSDVLYTLYPHDDQEQVFDYIVVGAGSAGSVIANKLARNGIESVLLLEAGKQSPDLLRIPSVGLLLQQTPFDWKYKTVPQKNACLGLDQHKSLWPMGKILGGTSMLNNMLYVRGHEQDFNEWFKDSNNYNYKEILEYFKRIENIVSEENEGATQGPVYVNNLIYSTPLPEILLKAAKRLGYPVLYHNYNSNLGFSVPKANLYKGKRWTSANNLKGKNLSIKTNCFVEKVLFRANFEAYGVQYIFLEKHYFAYAKKAVILSAGVIGTPKILMLSGIGKNDHLKELGIETIVNLPVGNNLQDHVTTGLDLIVLNQTLGLGLESMLSPLSALEYFFNGSGPWTTVGCEVLAFLDTNNNVSSRCSRPTLQFMVMPLGITEDDGYYLRKLMGISDRVWLNYFSKIAKKSITILPVLLHPKSKGTVRLASKDPLVAPLIDPRYFNDASDLEVLISGIRVIQQLLGTEELKSTGAEFNKIVFPDCQEHIFDSKEYWECYIRHLTITAYHPVGTCKMGSHDDPSTVVNYDFQVKGTNKLYIVDGSILPTLPSGNVNAPILMLAEMAGDIVRKVDYLTSKRCSLLDVFIREKVC